MDGYRWVEIKSVPEAIREGQRMKNCLSGMDMSIRVLQNKKLYSLRLEKYTTYYYGH
jgi:hypothetical protein